jgi:hypothetical protein
MHQAFSGLGQVELQVAAKPRVIIQDGECERVDPATGFIQQPDFGQVKVQVPEGMDMGGFEASHLALFAAASGDLLADAGLSGL